MANYKTKGAFSYQIQPGWTIEDDGFGLLTSRVTFINDSNTATGGPSKMDAHPEDNRLLCHKVSYTVDSAKRVFIVADYVGLAKGTNTTIDLKGEYSGSSQPIQAHPKFSSGTAYNSAAKKLKDYGWDSTDAKFSEDDADAIKEGLVGVKSFVAGEMSFSGQFYTTSKDFVKKWMDAVGKTVETLPGNPEAIFPTFKPASSNHDRIALMTNVAYEMYAHVYKVSFSVRLSIGGWHKFIYERAA